ncbi:MAG: hypothetical protein A2623_10610 [Caulobacterales bacterium RIFCSPHIGHO2_01_FULL_70_19]|nr:MAG: hypothetical protein A2623_10610 [Caulobacterales bacterium RIFCSPHIGHO2_01_FULL_70_19]
MRVLTYEECVEVSGAGRWGWVAKIGKFIRDVFAGAAANELSDQIDDAQDDAQDDGPVMTFDPATGADIVDSGTAWGEDENGNFQSGWYWTDSNGITWYDMNMDGNVESAGYFTDDGTFWTEPVTGGPTTPTGPN